MTNIGVILDYLIIMFNKIGEKIENFCGELESMK